MDAVIAEDTLRERAVDDDRRTREAPRSGDFGHAVRHSEAKSGGVPGLRSSPKYCASRSSKIPVTTGNRT